VLFCFFSCRILVFNEAVSLLCVVSRAQSDAVKRKMVADERSELEKKPLATLGATSSDQMENTHYIHDKKVCMHSGGRFHHSLWSLSRPILCLLFYLTCVT